MSTLEATIDELYALPLADFTAARNALAKTLEGDDAVRVKRLEKPSLVPWAVNQLYWRERRTYDRLMASGEALRTAQIGALKGRTSDVRGATGEHRAAVSAAVATANQLAAQAGARPSIEPLSRMLEALSLSPEPPAPAGRFTDLLQPAGFEALAGVTPVARPHAPAAQPREPASPRHRDATRQQAGPTKTHSRKDALADRRRAAAATAAKKAAEAAQQAARRKLAHAQAAEERARDQAGVAREQLRRAEAALSHAREATAQAAAQLALADAALTRL